MVEAIRGIISSTQQSTVRIYWYASVKLSKKAVRLIKREEGFYHYFNEWDKGPLHVWFQYNIQTGDITYVLVDCPEIVKETIMANAKDQYGCFLHRPLAIDFLIAEQCASWREVLINKHYKQIFIWVCVLNQTNDLP
jgi:hypothetical protein